MKYTFIVHPVGFLPVVRGEISSIFDKSSSCSSRLQNLEIMIHWSKKLQIKLQYFLLRPVKDDLCNKMVLRGRTRYQAFLDGRWTDKPFIIVEESILFSRGRY